MVTRGFACTQSVVTRRAVAKSSADLTGANRSATQQTTRGLRCQSVPTPDRRPGGPTEPPGRRLGAGLGLSPPDSRTPGTVESGQKQAIDDAKSKAVLTATQLGWTLDKPTKVSYRTTRYSSGGFGARSGSAAASPLATSANFVDSAVQVTFSYKIEDEPVQPEDALDNK